MNSDCLSRIFNYLSINDIKTISLTTQQFYHSSNSNLLWESLFREKFDIRYKGNYKVGYKTCKALSKLPNIDLKTIFSNTELNLGYKKLAVLPPEIGYLHRLNTISLENNYLESIPSQITMLTNLTNLNVSYNNLKSISTICFCNSLRVLNARCNKLEELPSEIGLLTNLCDLNLVNNKLQSLPFNTNFLTNLRSVRLSGNQLAKTREGKHFNDSWLYVYANCG